MSSIFDRRQTDRHQVALRAMVEVLGRPRLSCLVCNLSHVGALIEMPDRNSLPSMFGLLLPKSPLPIACEVRHTSGHSYGVTFVRKFGLDGAAEDRAIEHACSLLTRAA